MSGVMAMDGGSLSYGAERLPEDLGARGASYSQSPGKGKGARDCSGAPVPGPDRSTIVVIAALVFLVAVVAAVAVAVGVIAAIGAVVAVSAIVIAVAIAAAPAVAVTGFAADVLLETRDAILQVLHLAVVEAAA